MTPRASSASPGRTGRLSLHFAASELACRHCGACVAVDDLVQLLERVRSLTQAPLHILSGYRCPIHNKAVGGADNSAHMYGCAVDVLAGAVPMDVAVRAGARGIGVRGKSVVHLDVMPGPRRVFPDVG